VTPKILLATIHHMKVTHQSLYVGIYYYESIPVNVYINGYINSFIFRYACI